MLEFGLLIPVQKELSVSRRAQTRSQRKSMIVQVNKVPCSIKAIFHTNKTVEHYITIDEKGNSPVKPNVCSLQTTSPTMPRCHSPSTTLSPLGGWSSCLNISAFLSTSSQTQYQYYHRPFFHFLFADSPKVSPSQFAFVNIKKADGRRWSVASLPR